MLFLYNGNLRMAYNGLAIKMAYKEIDNESIFKYIYYKSDDNKGDNRETKKEKLPQEKINKKKEKNEIDYTWQERKGYVDKHVLKYINRIMRDKGVKIELEQYLKRNNSSVFASYLKDLCE